MTFMRAARPSGKVRAARITDLAALGELSRLCEDDAAGGRSLGLPVSSVHDMLHTMVTAEVLTVTDDLHYSIGPRVVGIALSTVVPSPSWPSLLRPQHFTSPASVNAQVW